MSLDPQLKSYSRSVGKDKKQNLPCWVVVGMQAALHLQQQESCCFCSQLVSSQQDVDDIHGQGCVIQKDFRSSQAARFLVALPLLMEDLPHCSFHLM